MNDELKIDGFITDHSLLLSRCPMPDARCPIIMIRISGISFLILVLSREFAIAEGGGVPIAQGIPATIINRPVLKIGSQGREVSELQAALKLLGYYSGIVDSVYGETTAQAVTQFQQAAGITTDGIAGTETWNRLLPGSPTPVSPTPAPTPTTAVTLPILREGMSGTAVVQLQERLRSLGFYQSTVDGVFGSLTTAAVIAAQQKFKLDPDGIVGSTTWNALLR